MINDQIRDRIQRLDVDYVREYAMAIERHSEAALDGDLDSIKWVKAHLKSWAQDETSQMPPPALLRVAALHFLGSEAVVPLKRAEAYDLPKELDAANIAFQAVCNDADEGDQDVPFKERIKAFVRCNWPPGTFTEEALERIARVSNRDTKTGPKRRKA